MSGLFGDVDTLNTFSKALMKDLAGNSFDASCYMATVIVLLVVLGDPPWKHRGDRLLAQAPSTPSTNVFDNVWPSVA